MSQSNEFHTAHLLAPVAAATAGDADNMYAINRLGGKAKVTNVDSVPNGTIAAHASNHATFTVTVSGVSLGSVSSASGGHGAMTDAVNVPITLAAAGANLVAEGGLVKIAITKGGSGVAVKGNFAVTMQRVRAD